jgi:hypothetical protein
MRSLAAICSGALLIAAVHSNAQSGEGTSEQRLAKTTHSSQQLPYTLVADAGANAAQFSDVAQVRFQYVQNYAKGAQDALIWGSQISRGYAASVKTCETASDAQLRTIECGYSKGIEAIVKKKIPVTLNDFGFVNRTVYGRVLYDEAGDLKYVQVRNEERWFLAPSSEYESLEPDKCHALTGYLSREGTFGARLKSYSREFVVVDAAQADEGACPGKN